MSMELSTRETRKVSFASYMAVSEPMGSLRGERSLLVVARSAVRPCGRIRTRAEAPAQHEHYTYLCETAHLILYSRTWVEARRASTINKSKEKHRIYTTLVQYCTLGSPFVDPIRPIRVQTRQAFTIISFIQRKILSIFVVLNLKT